MALSVDFADGLSSQTVEQAVRRLERQIKQTCPEVTRVFIEVQAANPGNLETAKLT
jgi:4-hydroxy-3-methylbut-2-enyl diphosphate reductase IspH